MKFEAGSALITEYAAQFGVEPPSWQPPKLAQEK